MIDDVREKGLQAKQESEIEATKTIGDHHQQSGSRVWLRLKDPRIVRVSRSFGGKDRHSKVRTIRGLRDRRVRLSVPTAIQLYDLQERLGLNQPSKVVDWLLNASQHEIEKLPPLQWPQGINFDHPPQEVEATDFRRINQESSGDGSEHQGGTTNNAMYTSYYNLDAMANVDTSNFGGNHCHEQEEETEHGYRSEINLSLVPNSQLMLCPSRVVSTTFHPYASSSSGYDMKYLNHYPTLATSLHNSFSIPFQSGDSTAPFPTENLLPFAKSPRK